MKLIYTHESQIIVENARNCLRMTGIEPVLKNEFSAGGMGELAPMETWPELWVSDDDFTQAKDVIDQLMSETTGNVWVCAQCGEENEPSFDVCWQCQCERQSESSDVTR